MTQADGDAMLGPGRGTIPLAGGGLLRQPGFWIAIVLTSLVLFIVAVMATTSILPRPLGLSMLAAAATLLALITAMTLRNWWMARAAGPDGALARMLDLQTTAGLITDAALTIRHANPSARRLLQIGPKDKLTQAPPLTPDDADAIARSDASTGSFLRQIALGPDLWTLSATRLDAGLIMWSLTPAFTAADDSDDALPTLTIDQRGKVIFANARAVTLLGQAPDQLRDVVDHAAVPEGGTVTTVATASGLQPMLITDLTTGVSGTDPRQIALTPLTPLATPEPAVPATQSDWNVVEDLPVALLWLDAAGRVQRANRAALRLIGDACAPGVKLIDLTEGLGRPLSDWMDETLSGARVGAPEFLRLTGSPSETFVQMSLHAHDDGGEPAIMAVLSDATELKTLEAQFVQSQKMHAIGQLAGGVAHDFNNLLTAISGHCDLLLLRHDQGDPEYADLMQINQNSNRAAALVNQLLAFSRKQTLRPEEIDLRDTLADLTHLLNRLVGEKVTLSFSHDTVLGSIRADKRQLEQVLMNLVVNARDAIDGAGEIRIVTERVTYDTALTRDRASVPPGEYVSVKVIDTGCGIPPDRLTKVFEPFYSTKKLGEGTGLGLSTAYGIIKQSGGFIFVDSTLGQGTCFTLLFRTSKSDPTLMTVTEQDTSQTAKHADGVVLLVEDEAPVRAFASRALRLRGYTVIEAESGEDALKTLEDQNLHVDIFVTDVVMPGMDGPTWVRQALTTRPDVRVIFMSGYAEENFGDEQARIPNSTFLPKPFSLAELTQTVQGS
ncbi:ATP-binding protein [Pseudooceanicola sp. MF1-13]|uniref:ATP-binding protein n=1 Tax=Pseudooceanicola sp. MF1-13 TaxID=3379095 RepID=UPI003891EE80